MLCVARTTTPNLQHSGPDRHRPDSPPHYGISLFPGRSASRPPPGIFLPSVVGSSAAYMMPGPIRSPSVYLTSVLERDSAVRQRGHLRHHRRPRPGKGTFVDGPPLKRQGPLLPSSSPAADPLQPCSCRTRRCRLIASEPELRPIQPHPEKHHAHAPVQRGRGALPATLRRQTQRPEL